MRTVILLYRCCMRVPVIFISRTLVMDAIQYLAYFPPHKTIWVMRKPCLGRVDFVGHVETGLGFPHNPKQKPFQTLQHFNKYLQLRNSRLLRVKPGLAPARMVVLTLLLLPGDALDHILQFSQPGNCHQSVVVL